MGGSVAGNEISGNELPDNEDRFVELSEEEVRQLELPKEWDCVDLRGLLPSRLSPGC